MENIGEIDKKFASMLLDGFTPEEFNNFIKEGLELYSNNKLEDPDRFLRALDDLWLLDLGNLHNQIISSPERFIEDTADGGKFSDETKEFVKQKALQGDKVLFTCQSGISRSKSLKKTMEDQLGKEKFLTVEDQGEAKEGYSSMKGFVLDLLKRRRRGEIPRGLSVFFFSSSHSDEIKEFIPTILQYFKESSFTFEQRINMYLGDFSSIGIEKLYVIQKNG